MTIAPAPRLADLTTLGLGGPARSLVTVTDADSLAASLTHGDALILGGGSNLVVSDSGVDVPVVRIGIRGISVQAADDRALVTIGAGEPWDGVVEQLVGQGWTGLAALSGIPGSAGATPIQNVGAYGREIADVLHSVTVYDRRSDTFAELPAADLDLGYRSSRLRGRSEFVITGLTLSLGRSPIPVRYAELARDLGIEVGSSAPEPAVRRAVLALRRSKGMVIDPSDPDSRSAGSFFTNPVVDHAELERARMAISARLGADVGFPSYPAGDRTKLSAAWLIERAGFGKGFEGPGGRVAVSSKHTLALINRNGTTEDLLALARQIRDGVHAAFGVWLHPEPILVGVSL